MPVNNPVQMQSKGQQPIIMYIILSMLPFDILLVYMVLSEFRKLKKIHTFEGVIKSSTCFENTLRTHKKVDQRSRNTHDLYETETETDTETTVSHDRHWSRPRTRASVSKHDRFKSKDRSHLNDESSSNATTDDYKYNTCTLVVEYNTKFLYPITETNADANKHIDMPIKSRTFTDVRFYSPPIQNQEVALQIMDHSVSDRPDIRLKMHNSFEAEITLNIATISIIGIFLLFFAHTMLFAVFHV